MKAQLMEFWKDEEGATAIEYALIAGIIAVIIIGAFALLKDGLTNLFTDISQKLTDQGSAVSGGSGGTGTGT
jgi:pilus assembly protein Flp/PilA